MGTQLSHGGSKKKSRRHFGLNFCKETGKKWLVLMENKEEKFLLRGNFFEFF